MPEIVASGRLPTVEELQAAKDRLLTELNERYFPHGGGRIVPFGSLVRGDATRRSDIDLCLLIPPQGDVPGALFTRNDRDNYVKQLIGETGLVIEANLVTWSSRRNDLRLGALDGYHEADFSPTTYDHFGFLARNPNVPDLDRQSYLAIQREIRSYSRTDRASRIRDLFHYLDVYQFNRNQPEDWLTISFYAAGRYGQLENAAYHVLRKLAGIAKTFAAGDGKRELRACFENSRVPFFVSLVELFDEVLHFGVDCDAIIAECVGRSDLIDSYYKFFAQRAHLMAKASQELIKLVDNHLKEDRLLDAIADYDRTSIGEVTLPGAFLRMIKEWLGEWNRLVAVEWVCLGNEVVVARPFRAFFLEPKRGKIRSGIGWNDTFHWERKVNRRMIGSFGRFELNFTVSPPTIRDCGAFHTDIATDIAAKGMPERARQAALEKLLQVLSPLGVVLDSTFTPSPIKRAYPP